MTHDKIKSVLIFILPFSLSPFILVETGFMIEYSTLIVALPILIFLANVHNIKVDSYAHIMLLTIFIQILLISSQVIIFPNFGQMIKIFNYFAIFFIYFTLLSIVNLKTLALLLIYLMMGMAFFATLSFFLAASSLLTPEVLFYRSPEEPIYLLFLSFTGVVYDLNGYYLVRPAGFFMEPGGLGLYIMLAIFLNKVSIKSTKIEKYLLFFGLFSFSFGFYVSMFIYILFTYNLTKIIKTILAAIFLWIVVYFFREDIVIFSTLNALFYSRFDISSGDLLAGMQARNDMNILAFTSLLESPFFGTIIGSNDSHASFVGFISENGVVGSLILLAPLLWILILSIHRNIYIYIVISVILWMNLYHRPFVGHILYVLFIFIIFEYMRRSCTFKKAK